MAKFGEVINGEKTVLICFNLGYEATNENTLKEVVTVFTDKLKVVKIDIPKNRILADRLNINDVMTYVIYKGGEIRWREEGVKTTLQLVIQLQQFI